MSGNTVRLRYDTVTAGISSVFIETMILVQLRYGTVSFPLIRKRLYKFLIAEKRTCTQPHRGEIYLKRVTKQLLCLRVA